MNKTGTSAAPACRGVLLRSPQPLDATAQQLAALQRLGAPELAPQVDAEAGQDAQGHWVRLRLTAGAAQAWAPGFDTTRLAARLGLHTLEHQDDLRREIVLAMLMNPAGYEYPGLDELESAVRIRINIVQAARRTSLAFDTRAAERPQDCWAYVKDRGFTLQPGVSLIDALIRTTQPEVSGRRYSFSCYRATEYVTLLGIAQELARCNPGLYARLEALWRQRAVQSEEFHTVFLREQGTLEAPLPPLYYVPGDRVWFRNPDEASADACGFEGSWVMYLGGGLFTNFWQERQQYTITDKCVEIYHWRHGLYRDDQGEAQIDEQRIQPLIAATKADAGALAGVMARMTRWREPRGVYTEAGGCMDATREFARWVRPGTSDMAVPDH